MNEYNKLYFLGGLVVGIVFTGTLSLFIVRNMGNIPIEKIETISYQTNYNKCVERFYLYNKPTIENCNKILNTEPKVEKHFYFKCGNDLLITVPMERFEKENCKIIDI